MTQAENFQDTPEHFSGQTSSIGGIWPPAVEYAERIKAFYNLNYIDSPRSLADLYFKFMHQHDRMDGEIVSRVQFRALFADGFLRTQTGNPFLIRHLEAVIPLEKQIRGQSLTLAYLSSNHPGRQSHPGDQTLAWANYRQAVGCPPRSAAEMLSRALTNGYSIEILPQGDTCPDTVGQLTDLYIRFDRSRQDVVEMLQNPHNTISVARDRGEIVSAGIAEEAVVPIPDGDLKITEITEAATKNGHGNQGLYTAVSTMLLIRLASRSDVDLVFGECNALSLGVLKAVAFQDRTFSASVCADYGFTGKGLLHQQVRIQGADRHTGYNDLFPAFLLPGRLRKNYLNSL